MPANFLHSGAQTGRTFYIESRSAGQIRDLHYYAAAIISYRSIAGRRREVSDIVWVVYEYCDGEMIAREDWVEGGRGRLSFLCRRHAHIRSDIHVRFIFFLSHFLPLTLRSLSDLALERTRLTHPGLIIQTWGTPPPPLTGTRIPDITFTYVMPASVSGDKGNERMTRMGESCVGSSTKFALQFRRNQRVIFCFFLSLFFVNLPAG